MHVAFFCRRCRKTLADWEEEFYGDLCDTCEQVNMDVLREERADEESTDHQPEE
jgi:hypothetical protein